jgi:hypothetical protein
VSASTFGKPVLGVGNNRFLFNKRTPEGNRVLLASAAGERLVKLDEVEANLGSLFSVAENLAAYVDGHGGGLIDLSADKIGLRGKFDTGLTEKPYHLAVTRNRLWVCLFSVAWPGNLAQFEISDLDSPRQIGAPIDIKDGCHAVAAASDSERVYVSTAKDTLVVAPDPGGASVVTSLGLPSRAVHARHGYLTLVNEGSALVLRESDRVPVATLRGRVTAARVTSRGLDAIEYKAQPGGQTDRVYSIYSLKEGASAPLSLLAEVSLSRFDGPVDEAPTRWASHDDALINDGRVFRVSSNPPFLQEIRDPEWSLPGWMRTETTSIYLRDESRAVHIDATDIAHPKALAGGVFFGQRPAVSLEVPSFGEVGLYGRSDVYMGTVRTRTLGGDSRVRVRSFDSEQRPVDGAEVVLPEGPGRLWVTERQVYRLTHEAAQPVTSYRIRRWRAERFQQSPFPEPDLDLTLNAPAAYEFELLARIHHDDATAFTAKPIGSHDRVSDVYWTDLTAQGHIAGPLRLPLRLWDLAVSGDRVLVMGSEVNSTGYYDVVFIAAERRNGSLVEVGRARWPTPMRSRGTGDSADDDFLFYMYAHQALGFDGRVGYAQLPYTSGSDDTPAVVGVRFDDLSAPPVFYLLTSNDPLWSFSESDLGLVFSLPDSLYIARPWCP